MDETTYRICPRCQGEGIVTRHDSSRTWDVTEAWALYKNGTNMAQLGKTFGVSREAVRRAFLFDYGPTAIKEVRENETRRRDEAREQDRQSRIRSCFVCGEEALFHRHPKTSERWVACPKHQVYRGEIRRVVDPARYNAWRNTPSVVAGRTDPNAAPIRRYTHSGSRMGRLFAEAVENDWPLVALLPEYIVTKIREKEADR